MEGDLLNANQLINTEGGRFQRQRQMKQQFAGGNAEGGEPSQVAVKAKLLHITHPADFKAPKLGAGIVPSCMGKKTEAQQGELGQVTAASIQEKKTSRLCGQGTKAFWRNKKTGWVILLRLLY